MKAITPHFLSPRVEAHAPARHEQHLLSVQTQRAIERWENEGGHIPGVSVGPPPRFRWLRAGYPAQRTAAAAVR